MPIITVHRSLLCAVCLLVLCAIFASTSAPPRARAAGAADVSGELKQWHKITLMWDGPQTSETSNPNPFMDYRLDVTFSTLNTTYVVPGYYCADGNAAETSADGGSKWCAHFSPDRTGTWTYSASFTTGSHVALNGGGTSAGFFDGDTGTFDVAASDKSGEDFRGKGRAAYVGEHYLQHLGSGDYLIKCGADAPERALDYDEFDATNGYLDWHEHERDYVAREASPFTWQSGKGKGLLGAVNYLATTGCNAMSFLTFSLSGDSRSVAPHLDNSDGAPAQWSDVYGDRFDVSKMAQWERVMQYADQKGVFLHFKTMETENDQEMTWDERRIYYRMLIAVFGHHLALNWNLGEEISINESLIRDTLAYIKDIDPYNHLRVFHTFPGDKGRYTTFLGPGEDLTGASLQSAQGSVAGDVKTWVANSAVAGKKWVVSSDEQGSANEGVDADPNERKAVREEVTWGTLMSGGAGVEFYYGYQTTFQGDSCSDLTCDNHRSRESKYLDAGIALQFFRDHLPFWEMESMNGISSSPNDYVFGKAGEVYAVYLPSGGSTDITVSATDAWTLNWFDPRTGEFVGGTLQFDGACTFNTGLPPANENEDWVVLIKVADNGGPCPGVPPPTAAKVKNFTLMDADTDQPVAGYDPITIDRIFLSDLGVENVSIRANTEPAVVDSVVFVLDGATFQTENTAPYALAGDDNGDFNPWRFAPGSHELTATAYYTGSGMHLDAASTSTTLVFEIYATPTTSLEIPLPAGWSTISSYVNPQDPVLETMLAEIRDDLVLMKDSYANVYWPELDTNDIGSWTASDGYRMYMKNPATLVISGQAVNAAETPISLPAGWSMVAFLSDTPIAIDEALTSISGQLILAKNGAGDVYWPSLNVDEIGDMQPGQGYRLYLQGPGTLTYPDD